MEDMTEQIIKKAANALFAQAELGQLAGFALDVTGSTGGVDRALDGARKRYGGLWVGGQIELSDRSLTFKPNKLNRMAHANSHTADILLDNITAIDVQKGFITSIVDLEHFGGTFSFRCFGARTFAEHIRRRAAL